jgi:hypothetical protein
MIYRNDKGRIKSDRISEFLDLPNPVHACSRVEDLALDSSGWLEDRAHVRSRNSGCGCPLLGLLFGFFFLAGCGFSVVCVRAF